MTALYSRRRGKPSTGFYWSFSMMLVLAMLWAAAHAAHAQRLESPPGTAQSSVRSSDDGKKPDLKGLGLTANERAWLAARSSIRIGIDEDYAPYSFLDSKKKFIGVAPDFIDRISEITGLKFEAVPGLSWPEIVDGARNRTVDVIATAVRTRERDEFLNFTQIYIPTPLVIMVRDGYRGIGSPEDLRGRKVAVVEGYSSAQRVIREHPGIVPRLVATPLDGLRAVSVGEADAYVGVLGVNDYLAHKHGLANLRIASRYDLKTNGQRFGVRKDWPELASILAKALDRLSLIDKNEIFRKWVPVSDDAEFSAKWTPQFELTQRERAWLSRHREIRVGVMNAWPPMDYIDAEGNPAGIGVDFVNVLNSRLNGSLKIVPGTWTKMLDDIKKSRLDALMDITPTTARSSFVNFTQPYIVVPHVIFAKRDTEYLAGLDDLDGKSVAVERGFFIVGILRERHPGVTVKEYDTTSDALDSVAKGETDAYVGNRAVAMYVIRNELIENLVEHGKIKETASVNTIGVRKDWPILRDILRKALQSISVKERRDILTNWVEPQRERSFLWRLTKEEKDWLKSHPVIKVAGNHGWPPIQFIGKNGRVEGLSVDYVDRLSSMLGVRFEFNKAAPASDAAKNLKNGKLDMIAAAAATEEREKFAIFTKPYLTLPAVIFTRDDVPFIDGPQGLRGRKVAVVKGNVVKEFLDEGKWGIDVVEARDAATGLAMLQNREVFAYVGSVLVTGHVLRQKGYTNIRVSGQTPYRIDVAMASRRDWPEFASILQKAFDTITDKERADIAGKWIGLQVKQPPDYALFWKTVIGALFVLLLFLGWNAYLQRRMKTQSDELRRRNEALLNSEAQTRESEKRYRDVTEASPDAMVVADADKGIVFANTAAIRLFGAQSADDLLGWDLMRLVHPKDRDAVDRQRQLSLQGFPSSVVERTRLRLDGSEFASESRTVLVTWEGKPAVLVIIRDITGRKQAEEQLRQAQKMEAVGQLTSGIAHDFNNVLTVVLGNAQILRSELDDIGKASMADAVIRAARHGASLTQRLLAFARRQPLSPKAVNVGKQLAGLTDILRRTLDASIELEIREAPDLWPALADPAQLEDSVLNLVLNARDAMPSGGSLILDTANARLAGSEAARASVSPGDYVGLSVSDTGVGIAPETLEHVFEPFFTTKEIGEGSGLGLSMVHGFTVNLGGSTMIQSTEGVGTKVTLYLPRAYETPLDAVGDSWAEAPKGHGETILLVEDEPDVRELTAALLNELGYIVLEAGNGAEALSVVRNTPDIDLLVSDVVLPGGMSGPEIAAEIKSRVPDVKILLVSGYPDREIGANGILDLGLAFLGKPFSRPEMATKVRAVLDADTGSAA